jgi:hypothetical protein
MARNSDVPKSVRIRTGEGNEHRYDAVERAADYYDTNRSDAVAKACNDVPRVMRALRSVLERDDLTLQQRCEIAEQFDREMRGVEISVGLDVDVDLE